MPYLRYCFNVLGEQRRDHVTWASCILQADFVLLVVKSVCTSLSCSLMSTIQIVQEIPAYVRSR